MTDSKDPVIIDLEKYEQDVAWEEGVFLDNVEEVYNKKDGEWLIVEALQDAPEELKELWDKIRVGDNYPDYDLIGHELCNIVDGYVFDIASKMDE